METLDIVFKIAFIVWVFIKLIVRPFCKGFLREFFQDRMIESEIYQSDQLRKIFKIHEITGAPLSYVCQMETVSIYTFDEILEHLERGGKFNELFKK